MSGSNQNPAAPPTGQSGGMHHERALADVLDRLRNRFFGKYRGVVVDTDAKTMRVKATVPAVLGPTTTGWARASVPFAGPSMGFAFLPAIGSGVWIEFEGGDVSLPIWSGCYWFDGEQPTDASSTVLAIVTSASQKILFDTSGNSITISDSNGNTVTLDSSGITLTNGSGTVVVGPSGVNVNNGALQVI
jgi:uncharacterized protein involved in type VI secretion and phage assembly